MKVLVLLLHLTLALALPTKPLKYSLLVDHPFHPFNFETLLVSQDGSLLVSPDKAIVNANDWFEADLDTTRGKFHYKRDLALKVNEDNGSLTVVQEKLATDSQPPTDEEGHLLDDNSESTIFSIKSGILFNDGLNDFSLCRLDPVQEIYSVNLRSKLNTKNCYGQINGIKLRVLNQLGVHAEDFEAPEFIYGTGKRLFV